MSTDYVRLPGDPGDAALASRVTMWPDTPLLPSGLVTFVFTDIEGSTTLFDRLGDAYLPLHEQHNTILRRVFGDHGGVEVKNSGDGFLLAFTRAGPAIEACAAAQRALAEAMIWSPCAAAQMRAAWLTASAT